MRTTLAMCSLLAIGAAGVAGARIVDHAELRSFVTVENVRTDAGSVSGELVNHSNDTLENVRLLFEDRFHWQNEFRPGADDPGQSAIFTVDRVPPRSRVRFDFERPPRPERADGRFEPAVAVLGFTTRPESPPAGRDNPPPAPAPADRY